MPRINLITRVKDKLVKNGSIQEILSSAYKNTFQKIYIPFLALLVGFIFGGLVIILSSLDMWAMLMKNPIQALIPPFKLVYTSYIALFQSSLGSLNAISESIVQATPLLLVGLSLAISFRSGIFNVGGQGQILVGALLSLAIASNFNHLTPILHISLALIAGFIGGAFWGLIPGILKTQSGVHEVITTLMMNFIAIYFVNYMLIKPFFQRPGREDPFSKVILPSAMLPHFENFRIHAGVIIALVAALVVWWILFHSTIGFEIRSVGANSSAAATAGITINRVYILVMSFGGGLAGLAGAINLLGVHYSLFPNFAGSAGFDGITVALLGRTYPLGVVMSALLLGMLRAGALGMQASTSVSSDIIVMIQAVVIAFLTSSYLIRKIFGIKEISSTTIETLSKGWGK